MGKAITNHPHYGSIKKRPPKSILNLVSGAMNDMNDYRNENF